LLEAWLRFTEVQLPKALSLAIWNSLVDRSTLLLRSKLTVVPVPSRLYSLMLMPLELAPPERLALTPRSRLQVSRVMTSMSTTPSRQAVGRNSTS
jgi:hypothetical protein